MPQEAASTISLDSFLLRFILLFSLFNLASSQTIINSLPGFNGTLPFKLETGYISVGEDDDVQLFYYFVESERNPVKDPLVLWLTGGPGCSAFSAFVFEIGPLSFGGSLPSFLLNPYSWTKVANVIFLDSPVGTGFSYSTTAEGYYSSDTKTAKETYTFLQKWLFKHPNFIKHRLYIAGDSYAGKMVPIVATEITKGNEAGVEPHMILKGIFMGNPTIDPHQDANERIAYAHRMALISDQYYKCIDNVNTGHILEPKCGLTAPGRVGLKSFSKDDSGRILLRSDIDEPWFREFNMQCIDSGHILVPECGLSAPGQVGLKSFSEDDSGGILRSDMEEAWCRDYNYVPVDVWANNPTVQEAIQIRKGTKGIWIRCNKTLAYEMDVKSAFPYLQYLSKKDYEVLIYSGDHDMVVPYISSLKSSRQLNLTPDESWRPWFVNGQIAGYTEKFKEKRFSLTFATVKGAGHTAPEYKPKECFSMINRWLSGYAL